MWKRSLMAQSALFLTTFGCSGAEFGEGGEAEFDSSTFAISHQASSLRASDITCDSAGLSWSTPPFAEDNPDPADDLAGYALLARLDSSDPWVGFGDPIAPDATSYAISGLQSGTFHQFMLCVVDWNDGIQCGEEPHPGTGAGLAPRVSVVTRSPGDCEASGGGQGGGGRLEAPSRVQAHHENRRGSLRVRWRDNSRSELDFRVHYKWEHGFVGNYQDVPANTTSLLLDDLREGENYTIKVCARSQNDTQCSGEIEATTLGRPRPPSINAPSRVVARAGKTEISVKWQDNSNNEDSFSVRYRPWPAFLYGDGYEFADENETSAVVEGLRKGTAYSIKACATRYVVGHGFVHGCSDPIVVETLGQNPLECTVQMVTDSTLCGWTNVTSAAQCGVETVVSGAVCGFEAVTSAAECGVETVTSAAQCGVETVTSAAQCGVDTVTSAAQCGVETVTSAAQCGVETVTSGPLCGFQSGVCQLLGTCEPLTCETPASCEVPSTCEVPATCEVAATCETPRTCDVAMECEVPASCDVPATCKQTVCE